MKIVSIVGARPQFIKAAPFSLAVRKSHHEILINTGQHYSDNMSEIFFLELGIPAPDYNLGIGSGTHGAMTGAMLQAIEAVLLFEKPDTVIVYGDTNSTLAGALAAAKLMLPVTHIEAGLRSFNRKMPEEINRVITDHISNILFCPSNTAVENLKNEGITQNVWQVGDIMADALSISLPVAQKTSKIIDHLGISTREYILTTVHRPQNTDDPQALQGILMALDRLALPVIFPIHPRTRIAMETNRFSFQNYPNIRFIEAVGYLDMLQLEQSAALIITDSGGIQKEAYWLKIPCITLREDTEWTETVAAGWNRLTPVQSDKIVEAANRTVIPIDHPVLYGDGRTAIRIVERLDRSLR